MLWTNGEKRDFLDECVFPVRAGDECWKHLRVEKFALLHGAYATFYNICVISNVFLNLNMAYAHMRFLIKQGDPGRFRSETTTKNIGHVFRLFLWWAFVSEKRIFQNLIVIYLSNLIYLYCLFHYFSMKPVEL